MNRRECSDCRENEKTFRNNMQYKCVNDYCENYIAPLKETKKIEDNKFHCLEYIGFLENEISRLTKELNLLRYENKILKDENISQANIIEAKRERKPNLKYV
jgi:hypothetical protein